VEANNSCAGILIFGSFFFIVFCQSFFPFFPPLFTSFFLLSVLLSFLLLSNWFLFLSSFIFPLLFRHCFIPVSLTHVVSYLAYPNLLGTKRLGCCCCCIKLTKGPNFMIPSCTFTGININHNNNMHSHQANKMQRDFSRIF
jgi:hypothetical protein